MNKLKYLFLCLSLSALSFSTMAAQKSVFELFILKDGLPDKTGRVLLSNESSYKTNEDGLVRFKLKPGQYQVKVMSEGKIIHEFNASVKDRSNTQLLLHSISEQASPVIDVESSDSSVLSTLPKASTKTGVKKSKGKSVIKAQVFSLESGVPVPGARVFISGVSETIKTDESGKFEINVSSGVYSLSIVHADFSTRSFTDVSLNDNETFDKRVELTPSAVELEEYTVTAPMVEGGALALLDEQRSTSSVVEVIGSAQMSASGDSNAAGALKRVTGLTLIDGKFIYVRGLGERYSSTVLNGSGMPSPDPTRKVVPLDLFPTGILESVVIQKTYSPDMPGDFAGGVVQLRTKSVPEEKVRKVSLTVGGNTQSTGMQGLDYEGGDTDYLGIDDGDRGMPAYLSQISNGGSSVLTNLTDAQIEQAGESLPVNYATSQQALGPDFSFKTNMANRNEQYDADWGWGYNFAFNVSSKSRLREEERANYGLDGSGGLTQFDSFDRQKTENEVDIGTMLNLGLELGNNNKMESTTLFVRKTTDTVLLDDGYLYENDITVRDTTLEWVERELFNQQFNGEHILYQLNDMKVNWRAAYSSATREEPDTRFYRYEQDDNGDYAFSKTGQSNERTYEDLEDTAYSYAVDFSFPIYEFFGRPATIKTGLSLDQKDRDSSFVRFRFLTDWSVNTIDQSILTDPNPENILNADNIGSTGFELVNTTLPTDNYTAEQTLFAYYVMGDFEVSESVKLMAGVRLEDSEQKVKTFKLTSPSESQTAELDVSDQMPAVSMTWEVTKKQQIRLGVSQTVNRPDFKELSEAPYIDPESRDVVIGNPNLDRATITNYDLRWEYYKTKFETFSIAAFHKAFENPIEKVIRLGAGGIDTFDNAVSATNTGVELASRFWLSRIFDSNWANSFYIDTNLSLIESQVELGDAGAQLTNTTRPLQGQSPWVINIMLAYEDDVEETRAALLFNMFGERITSVGVSGMPDAYEESVPILDFVYSTRLWLGSEEKLSFKFKASNLLDPEYKETRGDEVEKSYHKGISVSAGLTYKWK